MNFTESIRYDYPLTDKSLVFDCGFHRGTFSKTIIEKYRCKVIAFEPIREFYESGISLAEKYNGLLDLRNYGVGGETRSIRMAVQGDSSGAFAGSEKYEQCNVKSVKDILESESITEVDLFKLNIEGMEFEVLEHMIAEHLVQRCKDVQVQFHLVVEDKDNRRMNIRNTLLSTHHLTYDFPWCWENYRRK